MDRPDRRRGAARGGGKQDRGCGKAQSAPNVSSEKRGHDMIIRAERSWDGDGAVTVRCWWVPRTRESTR